MLGLSLLANLALIIALFVVVARARRKIVDEKCATFAGCVGAMTSGLAMDDTERRLKTVSYFLATIDGPKAEDDEEVVRFYLSRASMLRIFRKAALADVGEHLRLLALDQVGDDDESGDRILDYISQAQPGDQEPIDLWGDELTEASLIAEKKVLNIYRRRITSAPMKLFG